MSQPCRFIGRLTMTTTSPQFRHKVIEPFEFKAEFDVATGQWRMPKATFRHEEADIDTAFGKVTLVATLAADANGTWDAGSMAIDPIFVFAVDVIVERRSRLALRFDTATPHVVPGLPSIVGRAPDPKDGTVALAAKGRFDGNLLDGETCLVLLEGRFEPNPWQK